MRKVKNIEKNTYHGSNSMDVSLDVLHYVSKLLISGYIYIDNSGYPSR